MDRNVEEFNGNVQSVQLLVVDFLGDESVCDDEDCHCGMDLPWAVLAEVSSDEYDPSIEDLEEAEETVSEVVTRACSVEAALLSAREFQEECDEKWSILLTDAASYTLKLEMAFQSAGKNGKYNWEDLQGSDQNDEEDDPDPPKFDPEMN